MSTWIDISLPVCSGMAVWPGDPPVRVERVISMEDGDSFNVTQCSFSAHTGTHMDAPLHCISGGAAMDALALDAVLGPCRVIEICDPVAVQPQELPSDLMPGERVLFKTGNSSRFTSLGSFHADFVYISGQAAQALANAQVRTVGIDGFSVGGFQHDLRETHQILLGAGIWVIEGLDLSGVKAGEYELACLPLRLVGADGAPARAALRKQ